MGFILLIILIVALSIIAGKSFYNMPNPGRKFYEGLNSDKKDNYK